jgi:type II secretory pathway pseudopilin PulG
MRIQASGGWRASGGFTGVDVVIALAVAMGLSALAMPLAAHVLDTARARHGGALLAAALRAARQSAVATRQTTAVVFDRVGTGWGFRTCRDMNGNGVRRAEVAAGVDACGGPTVELSATISDVSIAVSAAIPGPEGDAPSVDPVRFGPSDLASCSPAGGCSPGTVFIRSSGGAQFAVRFGSMTGRARLLRYEPGSRQWITE